MNKEELYDLIERYLDNTLADAEREEVEHQMATDAEFRAEVEIQRALHISLGDKGNFQLRSALDDLLRNPPPLDGTLTTKTPFPPASRPGWLRLAGVIILLAAFGYMIWRWVVPGSDSTPAPSSQPAKQPSADTASSPQKATPTDTANLPPSPSPNKTIAVADPADFEPNPVLEARIGDMMRGGNLHFEISSPPVGASFHLQNAQITLAVRGTVTGKEITSDQPLELLVYSNRTEAWQNKQPSFITPFNIKLKNDGSYQVDFETKLKIRPGLYYLVIGQKREDGGHKALWFGKFTVIEK